MGGGLSSSSSSRQQSSNTTAASSNASSTGALSLKIVVVGSPFVGKTSICQRFINNNFPSSYLATAAVSIGSRISTLPSSSVRIEVWDLPSLSVKGGKDVMMQYLQGMGGAVIVCDATDQESIDAVATWRRILLTAHWLEQKNQNANGDELSLDSFPARPLPIILAVNKVDLVTDQAILNNQNLAVTAKKHRLAGCFRVSALENVEIRAAFNFLTELIMQQQQQSQQQSISTTEQAKKNDKEKKRKKREEEFLEACKNGDVEKVESLIQRESNKEKKRQEARSLLLQSNSNMAAKVMVNTCNERGESAVHFAVRSGSILMVQKMVSLGAHLAHIDDCYRTVLHVACEASYKNNAEKETATTAATTTSAVPPPASATRLEMLRFLLSLSTLAAPSVLSPTPASSLTTFLALADLDGMTPLHLLSKGRRNKNKNNDDNDNADAGNEEDETDLECVRLLLQSKASPLPSTSSSDWSSGIFPPSPSPLHLAAERHRSQLCSLLLRGADDEKKDNVDNDSSPLAILLSNLLDCEGNSPLHCVVKHPAARNQQDVERAIKTIQILKGAGAERRMRNRKGESPASLAESRGWPLEVVNLLKQDNVAE